MFPVGSVFMKNIFYISFVFFVLFPICGCAIIPSFVGSAAVSGGVYLYEESANEIFAEKSLNSVYRAAIVALSQLGFKGIKAFEDKKGKRVLEAEGQGRVKARIGISRIHGNAVLLQVRIMKFNQLIHDRISARLLLKKVEGTLRSA